MNKKMFLYFLFLMLQEINTKIIAKISFNFDQGEIYIVNFLLIFN